MRNSGKLLILGILALAAILSGTSWWFRYAATNKAVEFWGPNVAQRIRDAPVVQLYYVNDDPALYSGVRDLSNAKGLTHLRYALLENHSFLWPSRKDGRQPRWRWALGFSDANRQSWVHILFTEDWRFAKADPDNGGVVSCEPIAAGLAEMLGENPTDATSQKR